MQKQEKQVLMAIKKESGIDVDVWAARQVAQAFDKLKIEYPRTPKSQEPSFTHNWLVNSKHKISKLILEARELNKFHGAKTWLRKANKTPCTHLHFLSL